MVNSQLICIMVVAFSTKKCKQTLQSILSVSSKKSNYQSCLEYTKNLHTHLNEPVSFKTTPALTKQAF